jgi:Secretion system C-terminal sorting domain
MKKITFILMLVLAFCMTIPLNASTFTSNANGNWSTPATWLVTGGMDTDGIPDADDDVVIGALFIGQTIFLDNINVTIANLTVNSGTLSSTGNLTVTGNFTWINGTIGSLSGNSSLSVAGTSTVTLSSSTFLNNTTFNWTGGGTFSGFVFLSGSTINIPLGATVNASAPFTLTAFGGSNGAVNLAGTLNSSTLNLGVFVNFNCTGSLTVAANNQISFNSGTSTLNSHTGFGNGSRLYLGGATVTLEAAFTTVSNFNLQVGNGTLQVNAVGGLNYLSSTLFNNGTINGNAINFNATVQQQLTGVGATQAVNLNNPNGLALPDGHTITNMNLLNGKVVLNAGNLTIGSTLTGADPSRYVITNGAGSLKRSVSTTGINFPIGNTTTYTPITLNQTTGTDIYTVRVRNGIDPTHPVIGSANITKEWNISRTSGNTTPASIKAEWNSATDEGVGFDCANARLLHFGTLWEALPASGTTTTCATGMRSLTKTGVTIFSPFAVGLATSVLPIELITFKATPQYKTTLLTWTTASEQNADYFTIERSSDGNLFDAIGKQTAKGQGSDYRFTDFTPPLGARGLYYRLKMVDKDGTFNYSKVISLALGKDLSVSAYPNPVSNELTIDAFSEGKYLDIEVLDVLGCSIYQKRAQNTEGSKLLIVNTLNWNSGIFFLKVTDGKTVFQQKIVKQ